MLYKDCDSAVRYSDDGEKIHAAWKVDNKIVSFEVNPDAIPPVSMVVFDSLEEYIESVGVCCK